MLKEKIQEKPC